MHHRISTFLLSLTLAVAGSSSAMASSLRNFTMISIGDVTSSQEVEGSAFIGGNLLGNGINTGVNAPFIGPNDPSFVIAGNIMANYVNVNSGKAVVNSSTTNTNRINLNSGQPLVVDSNVLNLVTDFQSELTSQSAFFSGLVANSTTPVLGSQPAPVVFVASPDPTTGVAVFDVSAALFNDQRTQSVSIRRNGASTIVFNVSGTGTATFNTNFVGDLSEIQQSNTIFNFFEASNVNLNRSIYGATLAPLANVFIGASTEGAVFAQSINLANGEIHGPNYAGILRGPHASLSSPRRARAGHDRVVLAGDSGCCALRPIPATPDRLKRNSPLPS